MIIEQDKRTQAIIVTITAEELKDFYKGTYEEYKDKINKVIYEILRSVAR